MTYANTTLLGLNQPTTGSESGVWGDDVNNGFTQLVDLAVAGTNNITQDSDITLAISNGSNSSSFTSTATNSTVAQYAILNCTGSRTAARNIIVPASSKLYVIYNNTSVVITVKKSAGTGVAIAAGEKALLYYDNVTATDVVKIVSTTTLGTVTTGTWNASVIGAAYGGTGVANNAANTITFTGNYSLGLTLTGNTTATFPTSGYLISTVTNMAANPVTGTPSSSNFLRGDGTWAAPGGTVPTPYTANGLVYASSTSALATGSALTFDGTYTYLNGLRISGSDTTNTIYQNNNIGISSGGYLAFSTSSGGPYERMRITAAGNVGIGTSSPGYILDVVNASPYVRVYSGSSSTGSQLILGSGSGTNTGTQRIYYDTALTFSKASVADTLNLDTSGNLGLGVTPASYYSSSKAIQLYGTNLEAYGSSGLSGYVWQNIYRNASNVITYINTGAATGLAQSGGTFQFYTAPSGTAGTTATITQAMTLSNAGGLSVGTTADPGAGAIYATGNITAYYSSDIKFKTNVQDIQDPLGIVTAIGSKTFDWTDEYLGTHGGEDEYFQPKQSFGVIAQDVQKVFPQAVRTRTDGSLAVDYEKLAILSFGAIGQLLKRVEALESK